MTLPDLTSSNDADGVVDAVLSDDRLMRLRSMFAPTGGLRGIAAYVESLVPMIDAAAERAQIHRILARWTRMLDEPEETAPTDPLERLVVDAAAWDVRVGAERDSMPMSVELFPAATTELIMAIAGDWNMTTPTTPRGSFDAVMPIGGLVRANLSRPAYAAELIASGAVTTDLVIGLASERTTSPAEKAQARTLGAPAATEQAALAFGMEAAFGVDSRTWAPTHVPGLRRARGRGGVAVLTGSAPPSERSGRRATTGEAFAWLLESSVLPREASVLQITTVSCCLANHVAVLTRAPRGTRLQTVGVPAGPRSATTPEVRSQRYLQEMKAFIDALPVLRAWAHSST